jgi:hypothetical protein
MLPLAIGLRSTYQGILRIAVWNLELLRPSFGVFTSSAKTTAHKIKSNHIRKGLF